jgi:predicted GNAT family N-acyltransferase
MIGHSKTVQMPHGYRLIRESDTGKKFVSEDRKMRDYKLSYFYDWSREDNNIVIIKESNNGGVDGVIMFRLSPNIDHPDKIVVEMLARNFASPGSSGVGYDILRVIENFVGRQLGIRRINIEAVKNLEGYYNSLGYEKTGENYYDSSWKEIVNMSKKI